MGWRKSSEEQETLATPNAETEYLASPLGRATTAHGDGDRFFELVVQRTFKDDESVTSLLADVEDVGWTLEQISQGALNGEAPLCVYLFRRADVTIDLVAAERRQDAEPARSTVPLAVGVSTPGIDPRTWPQWQAPAPGADPNAEWPSWLQTWAVRSGWYVRRHG
jgi:hypothetical protein